MISHLQAQPDRRRFLVLIRAGASSLHPKFTARLAEQNFDYALSWYGREDPRRLGLADGARFVHCIAGQKWPGLVATLEEMAAVIDEYDVIWMPDDDLLCEPETVSEFFRIFDDLNLDLAQPALAPGSAFVHQIVIQHAAFQVRFTNFVELMCPAMSKSMLERALPTMRGTLSGWGIDTVWPRLTETGRTAIIDSTPVLHTRPVLGGNGYATNIEAGVSPVAEEMIAFERYGVRQDHHEHLTLAGLLEDGSTVCLGGVGREPADRLLAHLVAAVVESPQSWFGVAQYLGNHAEAVSRDSRPFLPRILNEALAGTGLQFAEGQV